MEHTQYGLEVRHLISMFIDGHASVGGFSYPAGSLPFLVEATGGRYASFITAGRASKSGIRAASECRAHGRFLPRSR
jgi:hypothetical protein